MLNRRVVALIAVMAAPFAHAQSVTIDFDTTPGGAPVASGTIVDALYASQGVTFSRAGGGIVCNSGNIYANADRPAGFTLSSAPNVVSQCQPPQASDVSETNFGLIRADLAGAASQACVDFFPDGAADIGVIRAYDAGAALIGTTTSTAGVMQQICVSAAGIRRVEFSGLGATFGRFDDVVVTFVAAPPAAPAQPIPLLGPYGLLTLSALLGMAALLQRGRRR